MVVTVPTTEVIAVVCLFRMRTNTCLWRLFLNALEDEVGQSEDHPYSKPSRYCEHEIIVYGSSKGHV